MRLNALDYKALLFLFLAQCAFQADAWVVVDRICTQGDEACPSSDCSSAGNCYEITGIVRMPSARTDGTPLPADAIAALCTQLAVVLVPAAGGMHSAMSELECKPLPSWVVAKNWFRSTRPVRYLRTPQHPDDAVFPGVRVPVGGRCHEDARPHQTGKRQWRVWREGGEVDGQMLYQVYCERETVDD